MTMTPPAFTLPGIPADLQDTIAGHFKLFAGWQMMAEPDNDADDGDQDDDADDSDDGDDDKLSGGGLKALQAERAQRKALQKEVGELKAFQQQFATFAAALGGADQGKTKPEEALKTLTDKVDQLTRDNQVERIAREHRIEADADVALLRAMRSEDDMRSLAARLKPAAGDDGKGDKKDAKKDRKPRHDPSAGKGGSDNAGRAGSVAEVMEARRKAREAKNSK